MAIVALTSENKGYKQFVTWAALTTNDTGQPWEMLGTDNTVQIFGDFGSGATCTLQGSNDPRVITDPTNAVWFSVTDPQANAIAKTSAAGEAFLESPRWIRPSVTGGTNPAITVVLSSTRSF
jgi:hypothetical protein